jgi:hypothetical protein
MSGDVRLTVTVSTRGNMGPGHSTGIDEKGRT